MGYRHCHAARSHATEDTHTRYYSELIQQIICAHDEISNRYTLPHGPQRPDVVGRHRREIAMPPLPQYRMQYRIWYPCSDQRKPDHLGRGPYCGCSGTP
jgi:hypothetical protein